MSAPAPDGWVKRSKGTAKIYTHPDALEGRAVVESYRVTFNGEIYPTVEDAKKAAIGHQSSADQNKEPA